jgi:hypothetical protein
MPVPGCLPANRGLTQLFSRSLRHNPENINKYEESLQCMGIERHEKPLSDHSYPVRVVGITSNRVPEVWLRGFDRGMSMGDKHSIYVVLSTGFRDD